MKLTPDEQAFSEWLRDYGDEADELLRRDSPEQPPRPSRKSLATLVKGVLVAVRGHTRRIKGKVAQVGGYTRSLPVASLRHGQIVNVNGTVSRVVGNPKKRLVTVQYPDGTHQHVTNADVVRATEEPFSLRVSGPHEVPLQQGKLVKYKVPGEHTRAHVGVIHEEPLGDTVKIAQVYGDKVYRLDTVPREHVQPYWDDKLSGGTKPGTGNRMPLISADRQWFDQPDWHGHTNAERIAASVRRYFDRRYGVRVSERPGDINSNDWSDILQQAFYGAMLELRRLRNEPAVEQPEPGSNAPLTRSDLAVAAAKQYAERAWFASRRRSGVSERDDKMLAKVRAARLATEQKLGHKASDAEVAVAAGITYNEFLRLQNVDALAPQESRQSAIGEEFAEPDFEQVPSEYAEPEKETLDEMRRADIEEAVKRLTPQERRAIHEMVVRRRSVDQVARELTMTPEAASGMLAGALSKLRESPWLVQWGKSVRLVLRKALAPPPKRGDSPFRRDRSQTMSLRHYREEAAKYVRQKFDEAHAKPGNSEKAFVGTARDVLPKEWHSQFHPKALDSIVWSHKDMSKPLGSGVGGRHQAGAGMNGSSVITVSHHPEHDSNHEVFHVLLHELQHAHDFHTGRRRTMRSNAGGAPMSVGANKKYLRSSAERSADRGYTDAVRRTIFHPGEQLSAYNAEDMIPNRQLSVLTPKERQREVRRTQKRTALGKSLRLYLRKAQLALFGSEFHLEGGAGSSHRGARRGPGKKVEPSPFRTRGEANRTQGADEAAAPVAAKQAPSNGSTGPFLTPTTDTKWQKLGKMSGVQYLDQAAGDVGDGMIHLQSLGSVRAIAWRNVKPGHVVMFNYGYQALVSSVEPKGRSSVSVTTVSRDGEQNTSTRRGSSTIGWPEIVELSDVQRGALGPAKASHEMTRKEYFRHMKGTAQTHGNAHREAVKRTLRSGGKVRAEVLADYLGSLPKPSPESESVQEVLDRSAAKSLRKSARWADDAGNEYRVEAPSRLVFCTEFAQPDGTTRTEATNTH